MDLIIGDLLTGKARPGHPDDEPDLNFRNPKSEDGESGGPRRLP